MVPTKSLLALLEALNDPWLLQAVIVPFKVLILNAMTAFGQLLVIILLPLLSGTLITME
jgi:hypothetical protein